jgi:hypothetical protein
MRKPKPYRQHGQGITTPVLPSSPGCDVLQGPGNLETTLLVLNPGDVCTPNECQLTEQEKVEEWQVHARSSTNVGTTDKDNEDDLADIQVVAKPVEIGEGTRKLSWIWFQTSRPEDMNDLLM